MESFALQDSYCDFLYLQYKLFLTSFKQLAPSILFQGLLVSGNRVITVRALLVCLSGEINVLYICIYKLFCDQPVGTTQVEQHQSIEIVIIGGNSSITFIPSKNSAGTNVRRAGHGKYCSCCGITALSRGAPEFLGEQSSSRAGNAGLGVAELLPTVTRKKKQPSSKSA